MRYHLSAKQKEVITKKISSYLSDRYQDIAFSYLFGSFVSEEVFNDIDIAVYTKNIDLNILEFELDLENRLEQAVEVQIDVRVINNAPIAFSQNVIRTGNLIVDREPNLRADFEGRILKQYFDFATFRRRYLAEVENAPI
jgi:predicted nucleotidyltransferase